jgi:hypothetical protein
MYSIFKANLDLLLLVLSDKSAKEVNKKAMIP